VRVDERLVSLVRKLSSLIHGDPVAVRVTLGKGKVSAVEVDQKCVDAKVETGYKTDDEQAKP
jgi:hypothetical protein